MVFRRALDGELEKICSFYQAKEKEVFREVDELVKDTDQYRSQANDAHIDPLGEAAAKARAGSNSRPRRGSMFQNFGFPMGRRRSPGSDSGDDADSDEEDQLPADPRSEPPEGVSSNPGNAQSSDQDDTFYFGDSTTLGQGGEHAGREDYLDPKISSLHDSGVSLRQRAVDVYVTVCGLKSYIQLNKTGFSKALKKYDKTLDSNLRRDYMSSPVASAYPFTDATLKGVDGQILRVEHVYGDVVTSGNMQLAKRELRLHLREHVVWERNTVWREMIGIERKAQAANVGIRRTLLGGAEDPAAARRQGDEHEIKVAEVKTPIGRYRVPEWICSLNFGTLVFVLAVFAVLLSVPIMKQPEQQNCLAMLVFVSLLWATEVRAFIVYSMVLTTRSFLSSSLLCLFLFWSSCYASCVPRRNPTSV